MALPGRFELPFAASETAALSIELRERISFKLAYLPVFGPLLSKN